jgi:hypothetical protein
MFKAPNLFRGFRYSGNDLAGKTAMTKRLQLILRYSEYRQFQRTARAGHISIADWVRQALGLAPRRNRQRSVAKKLEAIRAAMRHAYPTGDIDSMLAEIEAG